MGHRGHARPGVGQAVLVIEGAVFSAHLDPEAGTLLRASDQEDGPAFPAAETGGQGRGEFVGIGGGDGHGAGPAGAPDFARQILDQIPSVIVAVIGADDDARAAITTGTTVDFVHRASHSPIHDSSVTCKRL